MISPRVYLARIKKKLLQQIYQVYDHFMDTDKYITYTLYANGYYNAKYRFEKSRIFFIHLPKTGGTSLSRMLENDPQSRFIHLNVHRPVSRYCSPEEYRYITILRNPVDQVWSYYQMVLRDPEGYPYQNYAREGLDRFLEKCWASRNLVCRLISGDVFAEPDEVMLEQAKKNLGYFYKVLSFQHFSDDVADFMNQHEIPFENIPHQRNAKYPQPTKAEIALIKTYNVFDLKLFEHWMQQPNK